jgi:hypothetical protein
MAKKSRRARRQETQKQSQPTPTTAPPPVAETPAPVTEPVANRKGVNFAGEYFYVYFDMRNMLLISVLMFVILIALSFAI